MTRPYSEVRRLRSSRSNSIPAASTISRASWTRRKVLDISPGQVTWLRGQPQMPGMGTRVAGSPPPPRPGPARRGRAADAEDAQRRRRIALAPLRCRDGITGGDPIQRQLVVGIGMAGAGLAGARRLAVAVVRLPGKVDQAADLRRRGIEGGIIEAVAEAARELGLFDMRAALALAN